jgi:hypothetical protein
MQSPKFGPMEEYHKQYDYLKYYPIVQKYYQLKHNYTQPEWEAILFLYSASKFTFGDFYFFGQINGRNKCNSLFKRLITRGDILVWRDGLTSKDTLYVLSYATQYLINSMYKVLAGEKSISMLKSRNPFLKFNKEKRKAVLAYRVAFIQMNKEIKEMVKSRDKRNVANLD